MNLQSQAIYDHKNNLKQRTSIVEDNASDEQVGDIAKIIVKNLFKI